MSRVKPLRSQVSVAFDPDDLKLIKELCENRGESVGSFIRFATLRRAGSLSIFSKERKKALELTVEE